MNVNTEERTYDLIFLSGLSLIVQPMAEKQGTLATPFTSLKITSQLVTTAYGRYSARNEQPVSLHYLI